MEKKFSMHSWAISFLFTLIAWTIVNLFIAKIPFLAWIIIEFIIGICEYFCKFVKDHIDIQ